MQITFTSTSSSQSYLNLNYPKEFGSSVILEQRNSSASAEWGNLVLKELWFEGACLLSTDFNVNQPCTMRLQCDNFCWMMNFVLEGEVNTDTGPLHITLQKGKYHTFYCSALDMDLVFSKPARAFTICLTRRFIRKLLGKDILPDYFEGGGHEPLTLVVTEDYGDSRLRTLVKDMMQAVQPHYIRRIFLEGKILEMLSLQLERLENQHIAPDAYSKEDTARLYEAKGIVDRNMQTPCSLIELARKTGLNDFKLKKGFKALFGHTVFGYLAEVRMDKAYQLLQEGTPVNQVSEIVGYKNAHHFTAAFKKKFNVLPSQINKMMAMFIGALICIEPCFLL